MASYKTPGVYVEEISLFPPSVAAVETAIPAFIGYTAKAKKHKDNDLQNVPTKINSVLEFVEKFGGAPDIDLTSIELDSANQVKGISLKDAYYLYDCIRMFYANGGGFCYIVSVGLFGEDIQNGDGSTSPGFLLGLNAIKKVDEPTLLVVPDAVLMLQSDVNTLYQAMLKQCYDLQDRFSIFDLKENDAADFDIMVDNFRNGIGMNALKYGAAYTPWIRTNLPRSIAYSSILGKINKNGAAVSLDALTADNTAKQLANRLDKLVNDQKNLQSAIKTLIKNAASADSRYEELFLNLKTSTTSNAKPNLDALIQFYVEAIDLIYDVIEVSGTSITITDNATIPPGKSLFDFLLANLTDSQKDTINEIQKIVADSSGKLSSSISITPVTTYPPASTSIKVYFATSGNNLQRILPHLSEFSALWGSISSALNFMTTSAQEYVNITENSTLEVIPALKNIYRALESELLTLPPSAALAGIYALVDSSRGVWKAPANVSLNNVVAPTYLIDNPQQDGLNIDVVAGKSINVIRNFTGKGILVWGARTLAGNDNEWRYISVRRFFNFAEESIKKATEQFVFEPNDANTWVKVRAMIENFLTLQWRQGALAGAKPEQAFFVRIGLGQTMTATDILEGRMNVEIGMAVVRPAEFIILKFSHKMQES